MSDDSVNFDSASSDLKPPEIDSLTDKKKTENLGQSVTTTEDAAVEPAKFESTASAVETSGVDFWINNSKIKQLGTLGKALTDAGVAGVEFSNPKNLLDDSVNFESAPSELEIQEIDSLTDKTKPKHLCKTLINTEDAVVEPAKFESATSNTEILEVDFWTNDSETKQLDIFRNTVIDAGDGEVESPNSKDVSDDSVNFNSASSNLKTPDIDSFTVKTKTKHLGKTLVPIEDAVVEPANFENAASDVETPEVDLGTEQLDTLGKTLTDAEDAVVEFPNPNKMSYDSVDSESTPLNLETLETDSLADEPLSTILIKTEDTEIKHGNSKNVTKESTEFESASSDVETLQTDSETGHLDILGKSLTTPEDAVVLSPNTKNWSDAPLDLENQESCSVISGSEMGHFGKTLVTTEDAVVKLASSKTVSEESSDFFESVPKVGSITSNPAPEHLDSLGKALTATEDARLKNASNGFAEFGSAPLDLKTPLADSEKFSSTIEVEPASPKNFPKESVEFESSSSDVETPNLENTATITKGAAVDHQSLKKILEYHTKLHTAEVDSLLTDYRGGRLDPLDKSSTTTENSTSEELEVTDDILVASIKYFSKRNSDNFTISGSGRVTRISLEFWPWEKSLPKSIDIWLKLTINPIDIFRKFIKRNNSKNLESSELQTPTEEYLNDFQSCSESSESEFEVLTHEELFFEYHKSNCHDEGSDSYYTASENEDSYEVVTHADLESKDNLVMDTTDQPNSMCHVSAIQMYQPPQPPPHQQPVEIPFDTLDGEGILYNGKTVDGQITVTSYRLYLQTGDVHHLIPLGLIENIEHRELFYLHIGGKDARTFRCTFSNNETCLEWFEKLTKYIEPRRCLEENFAFFNYAWAKHRGGPEFEEKLRNARLYTYDYGTFKQEMERLQFEGDSWRISEANQDYKLCPSYPPYLIVPSCINDTMLEAVAKFRSSRRIPAVVWRHVKNGAVIARSSQPEVGWLGWRSSEDEDLLKAISQACSFDQRHDKESLLSHSPGSLHSEDSLQITTEITSKEKKVLILDARSYTTAVANRARGGGCECPEYYPNCDIMFMNLANIHSIRKSFQALRLLCTGPMDLPNWHSQLEGTRWMQHMSVLMKAAFTLVKAVEREARPVLVHCSDGWDRTPQIVALAQLMLDPYYRTIDGFRILIEREWLAFGHKFADRCGHAPNGDTNERCPVFLQWLDCVHQLLDQFQCAFEFSQSYLVKLVHHVYSNLYGTFLCNTYQERMNVVNEKTFSVWDFLNAPQFKNHLYAGPGSSGGVKVLWPQCNIRDLRFWQEMYLGSLESNHGTGGGSGSCPGPPESSPSHMTKTRSYGDLINAADVGPSQIRRSSDPSINIDKKLVISQESNSPTQDIVSVVHTAEQQQQQLPSTANGDFLCNDTDEVECNKDCIYKNVNGVDKPTFNIIQVDSGGVNGEMDGHFLTDNVINGEKTEENECVDDVREVLRNAYLNDDLTPSYHHSNDVDSDNELTEKSESKSENTVCDLGMTERLETSTDTLVSDSHNISSSPLEVNGFEKLQSPEENGDTTDGYKLSAQNLKLVNAVCNGKPEIPKESISPVYSRASSSSGWDTGLQQHRQWHQTHPFNLGEDGLVPVTSVAQERLWQIIQEQRRKEELLEKELHTYRQALLKQSCHRCNNNDSEKIDDTSDSESESSNRSVLSSPQRISSPITNKAGSVVESIYSAGEGQASAVESLRSDMSWEAVEDNCILTECTATLWVPDHAVSRCTGCQTEFWVGKRKHHCRKCGRIFCASCSENSTPLPSEQLYNPVRVCTGCYSKLRRDCGELPDQCKHSNGQPTNSNPQITASSN